MKRWFLRACAALAVLLTGACATSTVAPDPITTPPKAGESMVVISVTANTGQVTGFDSITVKRIVAAEAPVQEHVMKQILPGLARDTSIFAGVLPEGEYELSRFTDSRTRQFLNVSEVTRREIGRFTVRGGIPVDLGRLVVTPVNTRALIGRSARVTSNADLLRRFAPEQARLLAGGAVAGWNAPRATEDRAEEYALQRPVGADQPTEAADGRIVAASRLGTVLVRSPAGRWTALRGEGIESLLHAIPVDLPDARILAVGEFGTLLRQPPGEERLVPVDTGDLPPGNLLFIGGNARSGWYLAHQNGNDITLFRSAKLQAGQWQAVRKGSVALSLWSGPNHFWTWSTPRGMAYAVSEGSIHLLDYASGTWTERKAPNGSRLVSIAPNPGGSLGILTSPGGGFAGVFATMYLSKDGGASWQEIKPEFSIKVTPPYQTPKGTLLVAGGVFSNPELHASLDEGKTWQRAGAYRLDRKLAVLPSGALLAVDAARIGLFSIQHSSDEGVTWRTEYSNFDRAAYEADEKRKKQP